MESSRYINTNYSNINTCSSNLNNTESFIQSPTTKSRELDRENRMLRNQIKQLENSVKQLHQNSSRRPKYHLKDDKYDFGENIDQEIYSSDKSSEKNNNDFRSPLNDRQSVLIQNLQSSLSPQQKYQNTIENYKNQIQHMRNYLRDLETKSITPSRSQNTKRLLNNNQATTTINDDMTTQPHTQEKDNSQVQKLSVNVIPIKGNIENKNLEPQYCSLRSSQKLIIENKENQSYTFKDEQNSKDNNYKRTQKELDFKSNYWRRKTSHLMNAQTDNKEDIKSTQLSMQNTQEFNRSMNNSQLTSHTDKYQKDDFNQTQTQPYYESKKLYQNEGRGSQSFNNADLNEEINQSNDYESFYYQKEQPRVFPENLRIKDSSIQLYYQENLLQNEPIISPYSNSNNDSVINHISNQLTKKHSKTNSIHSHYTHDKSLNQTGKFKESGYNSIHQSQRSINKENNNNISNDYILKELQKLQNENKELRELVLQGKDLNKQQINQQSQEFRVNEYNESINHQRSGPITPYQQQQQFNMSDQHIRIPQITDKQTFETLQSDDHKLLPNYFIRQDDQSQNITITQRDNIRNNSHIMKDQASKQNIRQRSSSKSRIAEKSNKKKVKKCQRHLKNCEECKYWNTQILKYQDKIDQHLKEVVLRINRKKELKDRKKSTDKSLINITPSKLNKNMKKQVKSRGSSAIGSRYTSMRQKSNNPSNLTTIEDQSRSRRKSASKRQRCQRCIQMIANGVPNHIQQNICGCNKPTSKERFDKSGIYQQRKPSRDLSPYNSSKTKIKQHRL
ncbi:UNKNOWN [Stylonychia lemnae]|uniref:Uncharacterized protein n=1 Tax=Stylonychia lemnae TaxID=5949 RepID=A0A077ZZJ9_STYLE|nr:UNKNOWN [Stylonychia lemnae]|eukprot:CDW73948.1 UNKNOWN [Stylonychia lemnae]